MVEAELARWFAPTLSPQETATLQDLLGRLRSAQRPSVDSQGGRSVSGGTMRAVVLDGPGPAEALVIRERPPSPCRGQARCSSGSPAFGLNRSELHTRLGSGRGRHVSARARDRSCRRGGPLPRRRVRRRARRSSP